MILSLWILICINPLDCRLPVSQQDVPVAAAEEDELQSDLTVYREYIGKRVYHKTQKAYARVIDCDGQYFKLRFETGARAGKDVSFSMAMCIDNGWLEVID